MKPPPEAANSPSCAIGVDVGGTKIAAGIVHFPGGLAEAIRVIPTMPERGGEALLNDVEQLVKDLCAESRSCAEPGLLQAIGIGICEIVDRQGRIASAQTIPWKSNSVVALLSKFAPVVIEADVRAAALAEARFGAGRNCPAFLFLSVGTGISSCLVIDGRPYEGARGGTGTVASGPLFSLNPPGSNRRMPSLEDLASGPGILRRFLEAGGQASTSQDVLAAVSLGEPNAVEVVRSAGQALGATIGFLVNVLDPALVVLGGGLGLDEGLYRESLVRSAQEAIWWDAHRDLPIVSAETGTAAGVIGAATAAWRQTTMATGNETSEWSPIRR